MVYIDTISQRTIRWKLRSIDRCLNAAEWDARLGNSFGGKRSLTFPALASYLAFTRRNGVLENTFAGPSVTAGKTSLSWRRILLVFLAMLKSFMPSLPRLIVSLVTRVSHAWTSRTNPGFCLIVKEFPVFLFYFQRVSKFSCRFHRKVKNKYYKRNSSDSCPWSGLSHNAFKWRLRKPWPELF